MGRPFMLDMSTGFGRLNNKPLSLIGLNINEGGMISEYDYPRSSGHFMYLIYNAIDRATFGLITDHRVNNTVLTKLYFNKDFEDRFFSHIYSNPPFFLLYKVMGEKYISGISN